MDETITKTINDNPDSIIIGTPSNGGTIKVYGDFNKEKEFKKKIERAIKLRTYTDELIRKTVENKYGKKES